MPTNEWGVVITVVREDREVYEAVESQLDCKLANRVFSALLMFGSSIQVNTNKLRWRC